MTAHLLGPAMLAWCLPSALSLASDDFIAGYALAVLQHEFGVTSAVIETNGGEVTVTARTLANLDQAKIISALEEIPGVIRAELREASAAVPEGGDHGIVTTIPEAQSDWLPPRSPLFSPIHADPRWPQFSAAYRQFGHGLNLTSVFAANFGDTFSLYQNRSWFGGEWEFGLQAGVFSIFDISSASIDLVNADYRVGFLGSYRNGRFSGFVRFQHQSSHLGDEYLISNSQQVPRINLSYEEVDAKLSYEVFNWLRLYGGAGFIVQRQPENLGRRTTQWGIELTSARTFLGGSIRPVAYADFQCHERTNWVIGRSIKAGVQFENARIGDRQIQLLGEYYEGPSPDGQFYGQPVGWYGIGVHLYF